MKYHNIFKLIIILFFFVGLELLVISCASTSKTVKNVNCVNPTQKDLLITWGVIDKPNKVFNGYQLDTKGQIFSIKADTNFVDYKRINFIMKLEEDVYCSYLKQTINTIIKTQALNTPGDTVRLFEYNDSAANTIIRAFWNPKFKTGGNKQFRAIYDSLDAVVNKYISTKTK